MNTYTILNHLKKQIYKAPPQHSHHHYHQYHYEMKKQAGYNSNKKVIIKNQQYHLTEEMYKIMKYFQESEAIEQTDTHYINNISIQTWQKIVLILNEVNYDLQLPPPIIKTGNMPDYLRVKVMHHFQKASNQEMNQIYKASHYLKITELKRVIGVFYACRIFFKQTRKQYAKKAQELSINRNDCWPSIEQQNSYKDTFPFIN